MALASSPLELYYSKAFIDTIDHLSLSEKFQKLNFYKQPKVIHSYVSEWKQFVQVDDKTSSVKLSDLGVPQDSILGPVLFNSCIVGSVENVTCDSLQYTDDSTLYKNSKAKNLKKNVLKD